MQDTNVDITTVKELAILFTAELEHIKEQQERINEKLDKVCDCMYGNGQEGLKSVLSRHDEFIKKAVEMDALSEIKASSEFRNNIKSFVIKLMLAAAGTGGGAAAIWQIFSKAAGG